MREMRERVRIATWNCFGVPPSAEDFFAGNPFWPERFDSKALLSELACHDVVCIQENLLEGVRARLARIQADAGFTELWFDPMGPDLEDGTFVGGGLAILSRFPLSVRFVRLPRGAGPDGFARKGFAVADVGLPSGRVIHVVNTHLQADDPLVPVEASRAFASSSSMILLNSSIGCAPINRRPLMKKCGVPLASRSSASS
jgi:hypothetical protein